MNIKVGLIGKDLKGWKLFLDQEGIDYGEVDRPFTHSDFSTLIVSDDFTDGLASMIKSYVEDGGSLLCSGRTYNAIVGEHSTGRTYISFLSGLADPFFKGIGLVDIDSSGLLPARANCLKGGDGNFTTYAGDLGRGFVISLPFDAGPIALDRRSRRKSFYAKSGRLPHERVSVVSKGELRRLISKSVEILHHKRGLPYVHKWHYPSGSQTIFLLRIDTDYAKLSRIEELYSLIHSKKIPATWFLDLASQEENLPFLKNMEDQELGIHCYNHSVSEHYHKNWDDVQKARVIFRKNSIRVSGYAAPYGIWNPAIEQVIIDSGFEYSSEFSYDYDNLPSFPSLYLNYSAAIQVPVHPICIGSLRRQSFDEGKMADYFEQIIDRRIKNREPVALYHHPNDGHLQVLGKMLDRVKEPGILPMTLSAFAGWWLKRHRLSYSAAFSGEKIITRFGLEDSSVSLHLTRADGTEAFTGTLPEVRLADLKWEKVAHFAAEPSDVIRARRFNPWIIINRTEDKIHKYFHRRRIP
jgi:Polysaccharide deacetylase